MNQPVHTSYVEDCEKFYRIYTVAYMVTTTGLFIVNPLETKIPNKKMLLENI